MIIVNCANCNKEMKIWPYRYNNSKSKHIFCSRKYNHGQTNFKRENWINYFKNKTGDKK